MLLREDLSLQQIIAKKDEDFEELKNRLVKIPLLQLKNIDKSWDIRSFTTGRDTKENTGEIKYEIEADNIPEAPYDYLRAKVIFREETLKFENE